MRLAIPIVIFKSFQDRSLWSVYLGKFKQGQNWSLLFYGVKLWWESNHLVGGGRNRGWKEVGLEKPAGTSPVILKRQPFLQLRGLVKYNWPFPWFDYGTLWHLNIILQVYLASNIRVHTSLTCPTTSIIVLSMRGGLFPGSTKELPMEHASGFQEVREGDVGVVAFR